MARFLWLKHSMTNAQTRCGAFACRIVAFCLLAAIGSIAFSSEVFASRQIARMVWDIEPLQFAGAPLRGRANLLFLDANNELVDTIPLGTLGLTMSVNQGKLRHLPLTSPAIIVGGILDLTIFQIQYDGEVSTRTLTANSSLFDAASTQVAFEGINFRLDSWGGYPYPDVALQDDSLTYRLYLNCMSASVDSFEGEIDLVLSSGGGSRKIFVRKRSCDSPYYRTLTLPIAGSPVGLDTLSGSFVGRIWKTGGIADTVPVELTSSYSFRIISPPPQFVFNYPTGQREYYTDGDVAWFESALPENALSTTGIPSYGNVLMDDPNSQIDTIGFLSFFIEQREGQSYLRHSLYLPNFPGNQLPTELTNLKSNIIYDFFDNSNVNFEKTSPLPFSLTRITPTEFSLVPNSFRPKLLHSGINSDVSFDLLVLGSDAIVIDSEKTQFLVRQGSSQIARSFLHSTDSLLPGVNRVQLVPFEIASTEAGDSCKWSLLLGMQRPTAINKIVEAITPPDSVYIATAPILQIISLDATAPNAPKVNTGQAFQLSCGIANLSDAPVTNVLLRLKSDGASSYDTSLIVANLPAFDTTYVVLDIVASKQSTSGEIFRVDIIDPVDSDLPPIDNTALIIISRPPLVNVSAFLSGAAGGIVTTGSEFSLVIDMRNNGEGEIDTAIYSLESNVFLGVTNPFISQIVVGQSPTIAFTAPDEPQTITLSFRFLTPPIDRNTGLPAEVINGEFTLDLDVANNRDPLLFAEGQEADGNLFSAGEVQSLAHFRIVNEGPLTLGPIATKSLSVSFEDADGTPLNPTTLFENGSLRLADSTGEVSSGSVSQGKVIFQLPDFSVDPSESRELTFSATLKPLLPGRFSALVTSTDIVAELTEGPFVGQKVDVRAPSGDTVLWEEYIGGGDEFANSLRVKSNPINPLLEAAEFRFLPPSSGSVHFCIHTITGEIVYEREIAPEEFGSASPFVTVHWDGRTSRGDLVRIGVYIVSITSDSGEQQGKIKVAVVK